MIKKIIVYGWKLKEEIVEQKINIYSAGTAFFLFLSLIPILVLTVVLLPFTPIDDVKLLEGFQNLMPEPIGIVLASLMRDAYEKSFEKVSFAVLITLWSAGKGMYFLAKGLNEINKVTEERGYVAQRIIASFYTFILLIILLFSLSAELLHLPTAFSFAVQTIVIASIYTVLPNVKQKFLMELPGAVLAAFAWHLYSFAFTVYINYGAGFGSYGRISIIVMFMLWLYFDIYIVFLGAILNKFIWRNL